MPACDLPTQLHRNQTSQSSVTSHMAKNRSAMPQFLRSRSGSRCRVGSDRGQACERQAGAHRAGGTCCLCVAGLLASTGMHDHAAIDISDHTDSLPVRARSTAAACHSAPLPARVPPP